MTNLNEIMTKEESAARDEFRALLDKRDYLAMKEQTRAYYRRPPKNRVKKLEQIALPFSNTGVKSSTSDKESR